MGAVEGADRVSSDSISCKQMNPAVKRSAAFVYWVQLSFSYSVRLNEILFTSKLRREIISLFEANIKCVLKFSIFKIEGTHRK